MPLERNKKPTQDSHRVKKPRYKSNGEEVLSGRVEHYLQTWSEACDMDPGTLKRALVRSDYHPEAGQLIPFKAIKAALFGEDYVEKVRGMKLDNADKERLQAIALGQLVQFSEVEKLVTEFVLAPISQTLLDWKATGKARPEAVDELFKRIREGLPKVKV